MKDIHKVKQGFSELTTVNEMGMRSPRDMERVKTVGWAVLETAVASAFIASKVAHNDTADKNSKINKNKD